MQNFTLTSDGTWDQTLLMLNGSQINAKALKIELTTMAKQFGEAGLDHGGNMVASFLTEEPLDPNNPEGPTQTSEHPIFPGTFNLQVFQGALKTWDLQVVNLSHALDFNATQVLIDGVDSTPFITRLEVIFDYPADQVSVWYEIQTQDDGLVSSYQEINIF